MDIVVSLVVLAIFVAVAYLLVIGKQDGWW
jgi:hypothetical protein